MGTCLLSRGQNSRGVTMTTHLLLVPRLIKHGAIPLLPLYAFMAWTKTSLHGVIARKTTTLTLCMAKKHLNKTDMTEKTLLHVRKQWIRTDFWLEYGRPSTKPASLWQVLLCPIFWHELAGTQSHNIFSRHWPTSMTQLPDRNCGPDNVLSGGYRESGRWVLKLTNMEVKNGRSCTSGIP